MSLCWSIGVATLVVGHLSLFSVMFISIVIGIGIDYGIYFLFRYEEELFLGRSLREAIEITAARSGPGMLLGAVTAAGTFYVLMLTDFRGVQELGFIAGTAILLAWVAMMTVFPAMLVLVDRRHASRPRRHDSAGAGARAHPRAVRGADQPATRRRCLIAAALIMPCPRWAPALRALRLQPAQPPGPRARSPSCGSADPGDGRPLGLRRARQRRLARRAPRKQRAPSPSSRACRRSTRPCC